MKVERKHLKRAIQRGLWPTLLEAGFERAPIPGNFYQNFKRSGESELHFIGLLYDPNGRPWFYVEGGRAELASGVEELGACDVEQRARLCLEKPYESEISFGQQAGDPDACAELVARIADRFAHLDAWLSERTESVHVNPFA